MRSLVFALRWSLTSKHTKLQLKNHSIWKNSLQKVNYNYNVQRWLKSINDIAESTPSSDPTDLFAFNISYNEVTNDLLGMIEPLFNGNISETFWKTDRDNIKRSYGYQYDN